MTDLLDRARRLGIKIENESLNRLADLQELLADAYAERCSMDQAGEDTSVQDAVIDATKAKIKVKAGKK